MQSFITLLLKCSVSMSVISLIWMGLLPILSKRYEAKWLYRICLLLIIGWMVPFRPAMDLSFISVKIPDYAIVPVQVEQQIAGKTAMVLPAAGEMAGEAASSPFWWVISAIWLAGFSIYVVTHGLQHRRLTKVIRRWSEPITEAKVLEIAERVRQELDIRQPIDLKVCPSVTSPMLMGLRKPFIVLPSENISDDELALILKHEFIHFSRRDLWYKVCIMLATAFHWFNPVIYLMAKATAAQCEISCDALVLRGADFQQRKQYGEAIIGMVRKQATPRTAITTHFYGGKHGMKTRIFSIMDTKKKKAGFILLCVVCIAIIGTGAVFAAHSTATPADENRVEEDRQAMNTIIGPISVKQVIPVELDALQVNEFVAVGGPFTLQEGDIIQYDVQGEGSGHLNADLRKTADPSDDKGYLGASGLTGNHFRATTSFKVKASLAGTYYLSNTDEKTPSSKRKLR
ncbi:M56 family metallopeptidase [Paenibacillus sp. GCM10027626]|uniref:M56 family metallopeptidase n=1 Tax=Paenibacillus sp. GCM10027626 TaxID=3273411 RepID=UPI0036419BA3